MQAGPPRRRRARPVADAPIDALLTGAEELAKGWLLACLEQLPLSDASGILAVDLARDGPRICDAVARALVDEHDLRRLEPDGALEPLVSTAGELMGARDAESASRAVDALSAVVWSALRGALPNPDPDQISELAERLALITEVVRGAVLRRPADAEAIEESSVRQPPWLRVAIEDEPEPPLDLPISERARRQADSEAAARDPLWVGAVEDEIRRAERAGAPLALLLVELEEGDRVAAVEPEAEASATFSRFAQAVRAALRRQDLLALETATRAWVIARDTGRPGAQALGSRIGGAVRAAAPWRGAPLVVSVGLAVYGEDGRTRHELIDAAEESKFAAAAAGVEVAEMVPGAGQDSPRDAEPEPAS